MKNLVLTGAGGGMAKAMLPELARLGYRLLLTTRAVDSLREHCEREGIEAHCFGADLTSDEEVGALFAWVAQAFFWY